MKKYIGSLMLMLVGAVVFTACSADDGQEPGNDSTPVATVYSYNASGNYNPDNDCFIRVAANGATSEAYYLAELADTKNGRNMSDEQYADYVVSNGKKIEGISGASTKDVYITDLHGLYVVSVVAVNGGSKTIQSVNFAGLDYKPYGKGTYSSEWFGDEWEVDVEYSEVGNRYRIVNCWDDGLGFAFSPNGSNVTVYPSVIPNVDYHSKYGDVSANDTGSSYDEATKTFTFAFKWTVSAGSFGVYNEYLTLN
jgi:hypothetical protein